jgi:serine/threonine-protein kinase
MGPPAQQTADYHGEAPADTEPRQIRVALVGGSNSGREEDLYRLLRRRLLIAIVINAGFSAFASLAMLFEMVVLDARDERQAFDGIDFLVRNWGNEVFLISSSALAVWLWRRPPATVRGLRVAELALFGPLTVVFTVSILLPARYANLELADLQIAPVRQAFVWEYAGSVAADWMLGLILYAVLIPNTWRRCAIMTGLLGAIPVVAFAAYSSWVRPLPSAVAVQVLTVLTFNLTATVVVVVFASSRIEHFRQQAAEARKLGQYVLGERLGTGGMGEVYRAEHVLLHRPCAIKLIRPERAGDPAALRRFEREVQITATLTHPNTVQVYDYGRTDDGTFYYVMEYLPGLTLEALVNQTRPLPPARAIHFLRQMCGALEEAHARGLIHRDIKPGNVMICERGGIPDVAKLLDFGLVLPLAGDADGDKLTQDGTVTGTPAYLSPEQAGGQDNLAARSDIYSLGALAYFLLTGQSPFAGRSAVKMLAAHLYEPPAPLTAHRADVPPDLEAVILKCLAKSPADRFADVRSLEAALGACDTVKEWTEEDAAAWWQHHSGSEARTGSNQEHEEAGRTSRCT